MTRLSEGELVAFLSVVWSNLIDVGVAYFRVLTEVRLIMSWPCSHGLQILGIALFSWHNQELRFELVLVALNSFQCRHHCRITPSTDRPTG